MMHLYETHLPVGDTKISETFYREIIGLPFAYRDPTRDIVFLWVDAKEKGMLGLWGPSTGYGRKPGITPTCHFAFAVTLDQLWAAITSLEKNGVDTLRFGGKPSREPSVIGWMPSAQIYFRDPDGHSLEYIALLTDPADASFIGPYSEWSRRTAIAGEMRKLQGVWKQLTWEKDGVKEPLEEQGWDPTVTITGDAFTVTKADGSIPIQGTFKLDPTCNPKAINWTDTLGPDAGKTLPAIYSLEGDRLVFCVADEGEARPTDFRTRPGLVLRVNQREKP